MLQLRGREQLVPADRLKKRKVGNMVQCNFMVV
jgi:hypothetical protein